MICSTPRLSRPGRLTFAKSFIGVDCPTFADFGRMLEETTPDRVIVTTMDSTHDELIVEAMERGCDVIAEKPMTTDEVKCQAILDAQARTGRDITVTHNYRYAPHRLRMKELLMEGRIGRLTSVDFHWYLDVYHGASYFRRWHGKTRFSGTLFVHKIAGALAEQGADLDTVAEAADRVVKGVVSIGMSLDTCTIPGSPKEDRIAAGKAELGLGIHGEPGIEQVDFSSARDAMGSGGIAVYKHLAAGAAQKKEYALAGRFYGAILDEPEIKRNDCSNDRPAARK